MTIGETMTMLMSDGVPYTVLLVDHARRERMTINELVQASYQNSAAHGFWGEHNQNPYEKIALMHAELSEAVEALRAGDWYHVTMNGKPEGVESELADTVIRIADFCGRYDIDLERVIAEKMAYNAGRPHMHGKNA